MTCVELESSLPDLMSGVRLEADAEQHVASCPQCQARLNGLRVLWSRLDDDLELTLPIPPPPELVQEDLRALSRARRWAPVIAGVFSGLGLLLVLVRGFGPVMPMALGTALSALFFALAFVALLVGFRLSGASTRLGWTILLAVPAVFLFYAVVGAGMGDPGMSVPPTWSAEGFALGFRCLSGSLLMALPVLVASLIALRSARLPTALAGALLGAGSGLMAAGIEVSCPVFDPRHTLFYHGLPLLLNVLVPAAIGAGLGHVMIRRAAAA